MPVNILNNKISYFPVPKTACTSIKYLFYYVENGKDFEMTEVNGEVQHIHNSMYPTEYFQVVDQKALVGSTRIAVIRDPVARMLSAFSNRVGFHKELSEDRIDMEMARKLEVHPNPSPDHFFNNIEKFRALSPSIKHHTDMTSAFLGYDLSYYHKIYTINELDELVDFLQGETGMDLKMGREQTGGAKLAFSDLLPRARKNLLQYCYGDYALMRGYYLPPKVY
ncbi:sulfotransferase family 2 domain-containing protein [Novosphingobium profundi]|uniref:sulfotransferase family 2 domain-containing protein n=1 Tax=Novosphingobium profundi TaxID=1774954 RepID=UPI001CFE813E|nr:sulfotransferase family 2 domain-containing protein [Novosphingobium profundi]